MTRPDDDTTRLGDAEPLTDPARPGPEGRWRNALPAGTRLLEFEIMEVVGEGGFGIVYRAYDHNLQREVALKEFLPASLAQRAGALNVSVTSQRNAETFAIALRSFVNEARLLAQFDHPSLVKVYRFWEANGTAYMVMPYYRVATLSATLRDRRQQVDEPWLARVLGDLLDALEVLHAQQCLHRDLAPENVLMLEDGRPLLLDFGAARRVLGDSSRALTVIYRPDYAPIEQHAEAASMKQGPWTDIYALSAVAHFAITGSPPPSAVSRLMRDTYVPLARSASGRFSPELLRGLDQGLALRPEDRPQSAAAMRRALGLPTPSPQAGRGTTASARRSDERAPVAMPATERSGRAVVEPDDASTRTDAMSKSPPQTPARPRVSVNIRMLSGGLALVALLAVGFLLWSLAGDEPRGTRPAASSVPRQPEPASANQSIPEAPSAGTLRPESAPAASSDVSATGSTQSSLPTQPAPTEPPAQGKPEASLPPTASTPGAKPGAERGIGSTAASGSREAIVRAPTTEGVGAKTAAPRQAPSSGRALPARCADLLNRAQLGEELSPADMAYLKQDCH